MAEPIGALRAELSASSAQFERDMGRARDAVRNAGRDMESSLKRVEGGFAGTIRGLINLKTVAAATAAAVGLMVKGAIDSADEMSKMAQKTGVPVEQLSALAYAANLADVDLQSLGSSLEKLNRRMAEAAGGNKEAVKPFDAMGISVTDATGKLKSADAVLGELADKFASYEDGAAKTALAMEIFGKSGAEMIPMLNGGSAAIEEGTKKARVFGLVLTGEAAVAAGDFNDKMKALDKIEQGFANRIMLQVLPTLTKLSTSLINVVSDEQNLQIASKVAADAMRGLVSEGVVAVGTFKALGQVIAAAASILWDAAEGSFKQVGKLIGGVSASIVEAVQGNWSQAKDIMSMAFDDFDKQGKKSFESMLAVGEMGLDDLVKNVKDAYKSLADIWTPATGTPDFWGRIVGDVGTGEPIKQKIQAPIIQAVETGKSKTKELKEAVYEVDVAYKDVAKSGEDSFAQLQQAIEGWGKDSAAAIADFATGGKTSFSDMINSMINDIIRMLAYQNITKPLATGIGNWFSGLWSGPGSNAATYAGSYWDMGLSGGRAGGGSVGPGRMYEVNEGGIPEILSVGTRHFLMMGSQGGSVYPAVAGAASSNVSGPWSGVPKIVINNGSGIPMSENVRAQWNGQDMVLNLWIDAYERNKFGLRDRLGGK